MKPPTAVPVKLLMLVALLQGLMLLLLHQSITLTFWPYADRHWLIAFYAMALTAPSMLLLCVEQGTFKHTAKYVAGFACIAGLVGFYTGWQATPSEHIKISTVLFGFSATMAIATFKALIYIQLRVSGQPFSYSQLYHLSWRNALTLSFALLFALCFWGVLMLWAILFKAIKIDIFSQIFTEPWFYYPAISLATGCGVVIFRNLSVVIDTVTRLQQALMKFLLVAVSAVSILFLFGLLISGVSPLWETGGSALIIWLQAIMLFLINAVYQDEPNVRPYHIALHRLIMVGAALLPLYSLISFYGLSLRVEQYGWSVIRVWGFIIWGVLTLFAVGYLKAIITKRDNWLADVSRINVVLGLVVLAIMVIVNSPLLDVRKITVASQLKQYEASNDYSNFDAYYFKRHLARPGYLALEQLKQEKTKEHPQLLLNINALYIKKHPEKIDEQAMLNSFIQSMHYDGDLPSGLAQAMYKQASKNTWRLKQTAKFYAMPIKLHRDALTQSKSEYLLIQQANGWAYLTLFYPLQNKWDSQQLKSLNLKNNDVIIEQILQKKYTIKTPQWNEMHIGDQIIKVQ